MECRGKRCHPAGGCRPRMTVCAALPARRHAGVRPVMRSTPRGRMLIPGPHSCRSRNGWRGWGCPTPWVQTTLKMTLPGGSPDTNLPGRRSCGISGLLDPDNRRPVDYDLRRRALAEVRQALERDRAGALAEMRRSWQDGSWNWRSRRPCWHTGRRIPAGSFAEGRYQGLSDGLARRACVRGTRGKRETTLWW